MIALSSPDWQALNHNAMIDKNVKPEEVRP